MQNAAFNHETQVGHMPINGDVCEGGLYETTDSSICALLDSSKTAGKHGCDQKKI